MLVRLARETGLLHELVMRSCASFVGSAKPTVDCWPSGSNTFNHESTKDKENVKRVKGRQRIQILGKCVSDLNSDTGKTMADIDRELWKCVLLDMIFNKNKANAMKLQQEIDKYERGIKKKNHHQIGRQSKRHTNHTEDGW